MCIVEHEYCKVMYIEDALNEASNVLSDEVNFVLLATYSTN